jgi:hypothetical protein
LAEQEIHVFLLLAEMGILEFIRLAEQGKFLRLAEQGIHDFIIMA